MITHSLYHSAMVPGTPFDSVWNDVIPLSVNDFPWPQYSVYRPVTTAWIILCADRICIKMQTDEYPLLARAKIMNDDVYLDSCMEFFIKPSAKNERYLNYEFNPYGTLLLGIGTDRTDRTRITCDPDIFKIKSCCNEKLWVLYCEISFDFLASQGLELGECCFTGNFYKCGDETEHPHYASWSHINAAVPDFHRKDDFGIFVI